MDYVAKLTSHPGRCRRDDVDALRAVGWTDPQIHNAAMVAAYFNFINRIANGLGVDPEPEIRDNPPLAPWAAETTT